MSKFFGLASEFFCPNSSTLVSKFLTAIARGFGLGYVELQQLQLINQQLQSYLSAASEQTRAAITMTFYGFRFKIYICSSETFVKTDHLGT